MIVIIIMKKFSQEQKWGDRDREGAVTVGNTWPVGAWNNTSPDSTNPTQNTNFYIISIFYDQTSSLPLLTMYPMGESPLTPWIPSWKSVKCFSRSMYVCIVPTFSCLPDPLFKSGNFQGLKIVTCCPCTPPNFEC